MLEIAAGARLPAAILLEIAARQTNVRKSARSSPIPSPIHRAPAGANRLCGSRPSPEDESGEDESGEDESGDDGSGDNESGNDGYQEMMA